LIARAVPSSLVLSDPLTEPRMSAPADISAMSFEAALEELETIVQKLEGGEVELEKSIALYQRGAALKAHCEARLKDAQLKVDKIVIGADGKPDAEPAGLD
jgi:exodeoxyribonuclease VII small subunit